jgi:hypothetical protein
MFERFFQEKELIPKGNLVEISYEELTTDSMNCLEQIYQKLSLKGFNKQKKNFAYYLEKVKNYQSSKYQIDIETELTIRKRWQLTLEKWGYNKLQRLERRTERKIKRKNQTNN